MNENLNKFNQEVSGGNKIPVFNRFGEFGTIDAGQLQEHLNTGGRVASEQEIGNWRNKQVYGTGIGKELLAGLAGTARGLSFGLSDQLLTKTGLVEPESLKQLKEQNPAASLTGEVLGAVAPAVATLGESAPISAAEIGAEGVNLGRAATKLAPTNLVNKLGLGVKEALTNTESLTSLATKGLAGKAAAKAIAAGAGSAVEGSFYGAGKAISEDALGEYDLTAEHLLANMGVGAVLGAAPSIAGHGLIAPAAKTAGKALLGTTNFITERFFPLINKATQGAFTAEGMAKRAIYNISDEELSKVSQEFASHLNNTDKSIHKGIENLQFNLQDQIQKGVGDRNLLRKQLENVQNFINTSNNLKKTLAIDGEFSAEKVNKYLNTLDFNTNNTINSTKYLQDYLIQSKQLVDDVNKFNLTENIDIDLDSFINKLGEKYTKFEDLKSRNLFENYSNRNVFKVNKTFNPLDTMNLLSLVGGYLGGGFGGAAAVGGVKSLLENPKLVMKGLYILEQINQKTQAQTTKIIDSLVLGAQKSTVPAATNIFLSNGKPNDTFYNTVGQLQSYKQDPAALQQNLQEHTSGLTQIAPKVSDAFINKAIDNIQFLAEKAPIIRKDMFGNIINPPSNYDLLKFDRYVRAVSNPSTVLQDMEKGTLTREGVEVLKLLYPKLYGNIVIQLTDKLAETGINNLDYERRLQLSQLFGISLIPSNNIDLLVKLQTNYQQEQNPVDNRRSGTKAPNIASSYATSVNKIESK